jgi:hypothetical protein
VTHEEKSDLIRELRAENECLKAEWHAEIERSKTYARARDLIVEIRDAEISVLKALLTRAANALENRMPIARVGVEGMDDDFDLIAELRKAAG